MPSNPLAFRSIEVPASLGTVSKKMIPRAVMFSIVHCDCAWAVSNNLMLGMTPILPVIVRTPPRRSDS